MPAPSFKRPKYSLRPFFVSTFIITLLTTYALYIRGPLPPAVNRRNVDLALTGPHECHAVNEAADKCAFVQQYCDDDEAGLISYLTFYYCTLSDAPPVAFVVMVVWLGALFSTIGIAASDFFSINLSTIASILGLSESLAGVTFLAFGNGSPDVFSTFAAMGSNSGSMAVGELIGAAGFITAVVAGSMALVREFKVSKKTFVRDICFFIVAVGFSMVFLADGKLVLWECLAMIGFYLFYVVVVVSWHWVSTRRQARRLKDTASRSHFYGPSGHGADALEPYLDDEDDEDTAPVGSRSTSAPEFADISALERVPAIEINRSSSRDDDDDDEDEDEERHIAAEMTSSMRVMRPRWGRSNSTITPIRPSLVGALEFRAVLSSLQKERNMQLTPLSSREHSEIRNTASSLNNVPEHTGEEIEGQSMFHQSLQPTGLSKQRDRALSSGNAPLNLDGGHFPRPELVVNPSTPSHSPKQEHHERMPSIQNRLQHYHLVAALDESSRSPRSNNLQLQIPGHSPMSSGQSTPSLSPFPILSESPMPMSPNLNTPPTGFIPQNGVSASRRSINIGLGEQDEEPRPVKWWPYKVLPPPHILLGTLFPTLQGWKDKSFWDKAISVVSVPSIFLLVTTLPVVETEHDNDEAEEEAVKLGGHSALAPVSIERDASIEPETEWQQYRRRSRSVTSRGMMNSPAIYEQHTRTPGDSVDSTPLPQLQLPQPAHSLEPVISLSTVPSASEQEPPEWHRWLVALQLFTGPLFVVFIVWANMYEDLSNPARTLLRLVLYSLLASVIMLALLLLTTSPYKKPKFHSLMCYLGFIISIAWISTIAGEVVGVLKTLGIILGISEAILGLTVFAVGNSLGDLVADVTVARLGYPVMALSACFGGPMLNILLGVGIGGAWMIMSSANEKHEKHPEKQTTYKPYKIEVGGTLLISAVTVLITLFTLLIVVPWNKWLMSRRIGWGLIAIWTVGTIVNLVVEMTGTWSDVRI